MINCKNVVNAELVIDENGNRVSSYDGIDTSHLKFDQIRIIKLIRNNTMLYLQNPSGFSHVVYIYDVQSCMGVKGQFEITDIEFRHANALHWPDQNDDCDRILFGRRFYPKDFVNSTEKWTLYVEEGTFDEKEGHPLHASFEFNGSKYPKIFTERLIDLSKQPYIEVNGILHNWHPGLGDTFKNIYASLLDMACNTGLPVIVGHQKPKEDMKMPEDNDIKRIDPETTKGIKPVTHYEFDPEYFYALCAFTVIDLRTDPVTRYECILIETNPTHLVFAAFDGEKDYSGRQEFKNIKRLTVNMDRYLAGEFQLIRHAWECAE